MTAFDDQARAVPIERDVIVATGPDATKYLQGQLSQDAEALANGDSACSFILQPQGKVDAWFRITRTENGYILDVDAGYGGALLARLERFKLRTDVSFELVTWRGFAVRGPGASETGQRVTATIAADPQWPGVEGVDLLDPELIAVDLPAASPEDLEALRISVGVPAMGTELTKDTIPAEAGVVDRSVSFTKGCYTGQELVARIDSRGGNVPRHLRRLVAEGPLAAGDALTVDGTEVGAVTSSARDGDGWVGLAYIKRAVTGPSDATSPHGAVRIV